MSYFGAMPYDRGIKLEWITQSSMDSYLWEIMRGQNNDSLNYDLIATQPGDGNSNQPKHYYYDDKCARGTNWYKLKETDLSGNETWYGPVNATAGVSGARSPEKFKAYPNPIRDLRNIKVNKAGRYKVYNIAGQDVGALELSTTGITTSHYSQPKAAGIYFIRDTETGETEKASIIR
ncbi:MAG: T9SS type A sorting domain-containing protein [Candidatus Edwardsbacteria bacterium]|nr:T9SS type A sorting domain-containing protein [Candidatus Edwardsbacteria bacterium]